MPVYFVVNSTVTDPDLLAEDRAVVGSTFKDRDVTVLASTDEAETIEDRPAGRTGGDRQVPGRRCLPLVVRIAGLSGDHRDAQ